MLYKNLKIDEFHKGAENYLLSHFHADHMKGLKKSWDYGKIYCSEITKNLLTNIKKIDSELIKTINRNEEFELNSKSKTIKVTTFDANHCPGALMFLVESNEKTLFYTADFRLNDRIRKLAKNLQKIDILYLDSTYFDKKYKFPPQEEVIEAILEFIEENLEKEIYIAIYNIGKNKVFDAIYSKFKVPIHLPKEKFKIYKILGYDEEITDSKESTNFHAYSRGYFERYFKMNKDYYRKDFVIVIPTGWAIDKKYQRDDYYYFPYSEHNDYYEMQEFVELTQPKEIIFTRDFNT